MSRYDEEPAYTYTDVPALIEENERLHDLACADWFRCPVPQLTEAHDALKAEAERLRAVVEAALLMRSACPMDWTHGDCRDSQCAVVCCALAALEAEAGE